MDAIRTDCPLRYRKAIPILLSRVTLAKAIIGKKVIIEPKPIKDNKLLIEENAPRLSYAV
jgi:hypothetical protein